MNLETVIRELHATKLPKLGQRQLTLEAVHAPSEAARALLVARARREAAEADRAHAEHVRGEFRARYQWALNNPPREAEAGEPPKPRTPDRPEVREVRISWTAPKRPDIIRPERHLEMHKGEERSRAQRVLAGIAQQAAPVQRPEPMWDDTPEPQPPAVVVHDLKEYKRGCRCDLFKLAKKESRTPKGLRQPKGSEPKCGTLNGYWKKKCRCNECRAVGTAYARARYARIKAEKALQLKNEK